MPQRPQANPRQPIRQVEAPRGINWYWANGDALEAARTCGYLEGNTITEILGRVIAPWTT